jgi:hypothetical protein
VLFSKLRHRMQRRMPLTFEKRTVCRPPDTQAQLAANWRKRS